MLGRILPVAAFILLGILLAVGLRIADTKTHIPSPLIGKQVPEFSLPMLKQPERQLAQQDFAGEPYLANFWGSWCVACVVEHPAIQELADTGKVRIIGFNFRDEPADALAWLQQHGDPYTIHLTDFDGKTSIDFGVYAAPESFLVDASGQIVFKHIGPVTYETVYEQIIPLVDKLKAAQ